MGNTCTGTNTINVKKVIKAYVNKIAAVPAAITDHYATVSSPPQRGRYTGLPVSLYACLFASNVTHKKQRIMYQIARFTKHLTTILRSSYDNARVTID